jgi:hypothetical protein
MSTDIGRIAAKPGERAQRAILLSNADLAGIFWLTAKEGERRRIGLVVEPRGFEPLTSAVRLRRSPN